MTATDNVLQVNVYIFNICVQYHIALPWADSDVETLRFQSEYPTPDSGLL